jgi:hypothetical protein
MAEGHERAGEHALDGGPGLERGRAERCRVKRMAFSGDNPL